MPLSTGEVIPSVLAAGAGWAFAASALLGRQGAFSSTQAKAASSVVEPACMRAGEPAIAFVLAPAKFPEVRTATLELWRKRTEILASAASLVVAHDVEADTVLPRNFVFALTSEVAMPERIDVFEEGLISPVAGRTVTLAAIGLIDVRQDTASPTIDLPSRGRRLRRPSAPDARDFPHDRRHRGPRHSLHCSRIAFGPWPMGSFMTSLTTAWAGLRDQASGMPTSSA